MRENSAVDTALDEYGDDKNDLSGVQDCRFELQKVILITILLFNDPNKVGLFRCGVLFFISFQWLACFSIFSHVLVFVQSGFSHTIVSRVAPLHSDDGTFHLFLSEHSMILYIN